MIAENRTIQHRTEAYHRGQAVRLSVKSKGDWYRRGDQNRHRSVTGTGGKRDQRRNEKENRREQIGRNSAGKNCCATPVVRAVAPRPPCRRDWRMRHWVPKLDARFANLRTAAASSATSQAMVSLARREYSRWSGQWIMSGR